MIFSRVTTFLAFLAPVNKINKINETNQINQTNQTTQPQSFLTRVPFCVQPLNTPLGQWVKWSTLLQRAEGCLVAMCVLFNNILDP